MLEEGGTLAEVLPAVLSLPWDLADPLLSFSLSRKSHQIHAAPHAHRVAHEVQAAGAGLDAGGGHRDEVGRGARRGRLVARLEVREAAAGGPPEDVRPGG